MASNAHQGDPDALSCKPAIVSTISSVWLDVTRSIAHVPLTSCWSATGSANSTIRCWSQNTLICQHHRRRPLPQRQQRSALEPSEQARIRLSGDDLLQCVEPLRKELLQEWINR